MVFHFFHMQSVHFGKTSLIFGSPGKKCLDLFIQYQSMHILEFSKSRFSTELRLQINNFTFLTRTTLHYVNSAMKREEVEDQLHLFFYCPHRLWLDIQNWLRPININFEFSPLNILLGVLDANCPQIVNTIILLGKIFIFKAQSKRNFNLFVF